jgi:hypothetical protein
VVNEVSRYEISQNNLFLFREILFHEIYVQNFANFLTFLPRNFVSCLTKQKYNVAETEQEIAASFSSPFSTKGNGGATSFHGRTIHISGKVSTAVYTTNGLTSMYSVLLNHRYWNIYLDGVYRVFLCSAVQHREAL